MKLVMNWERSNVLATCFAIGVVLIIVSSNPVTPRALLGYGIATVAWVLQSINTYRKKKDLKKGELK